MPFQTGFTYAISDWFHICHFRLVLNMQFYTGFPYYAIFRLVLNISIHIGFTKLYHFRRVSHMPFQTGFTYAISDWFHICHFRLVLHMQLCLPPLWGRHIVFALSVWLSVRLSVCNTSFPLNNSSTL